MNLHKSLPLAHLLAFALIEVILFGWLSAGGELAEFVASPDTISYDHVARTLYQEGRLPQTPRTLGYPFFMVIGYLAGGASYGWHVTVLLQLVLVLLLAAVCWRVSYRIMPDLDHRWRITILWMSFWASLGLGFSLLSDLLAGFLFTVFFFGLLFWRKTSLVLVAAACLGLATLVRPTFTFIPLLLPLAAYLAARFGSAVPLRQLALYALFSVAATAGSILFQYSTDGYTGPSSIVTKNIARFITHTFEQERFSKEAFARFKEQVGARAGRSFEELSRNESQEYAMAIFWEKFRSRPLLVTRELVISFLKYLVAPLESFALKITDTLNLSSSSVLAVRLVLTLLFLPVWILAALPPVDSGSRLRTYYILVLIFLIYMLGLTAINQFQGERIRFPLLVFILPLAAWNLQRLLARLHRQRSAAVEIG